MLGVLLFGSCHIIMLALIFKKNWGTFCVFLLEVEAFTRFTCVKFNLLKHVQG